MTAMERTEELVHNLFVAQNELIGHLGNLKAVPNLARVLFGSLEKNRPLEKNSTPEKNSSEMEKIRQTWMDDVVGLASEFYINEEAFNLDNLTELLKATVNAITDILALGPKENSVDQMFTGGHVYANHKKKFTYLDKLKEDQPLLTNESDKYLIEHFCISEFGYGKKCPYEEGPISERCEKCWNREYHHSDTDSVNQTEKKITFREKLAEEHPELIDDRYGGGCRGCPANYWHVPYKCTWSCMWDDSDRPGDRDRKCRKCWDQEYTDPVDQTENWTCIDRLAIEHPEYVNEKYLGGASGCPWTYNYNMNRLCGNNKTEPTSRIAANEQCRQCWKQPYKPQV